MNHPLKTGGAFKRRDDNQKSRAFLIQIIIGTRYKRIIGIIPKESSFPSIIIPTSAVSGKTPIRIDKFFMYASDVPLRIIPGDF